MFNQFAPVSTPQGHGSPIVRFATHIANLLVWVGLLTSPHLWSAAAHAQASADNRNAGQSAQGGDSLEPGKPIERELSGGQSQSYKIMMVSGQYLHVVVKQKGIDVAVALFAPDGKKISEVNGESVIDGLETVLAISESTGAFLIEVRSPGKTAKAGYYEIKVEELRAATAEDKHRVVGEVIFREAERLQNGTVESKRKSVEKYSEAIESYRRASDRKREAGALKNIGEVYWSLGETQKALEKFNEALPVFQDAGDRNGEAQTLNNIGVVYLSSGEMQKALEKLNEALPAFQAAGDRNGEGSALNNIGSLYQSLGEKQKALDKYNESLPIRRAAGDRNGEAAVLNNIGSLYWSLGELQKALEKYNEALPIRRETGDRNAEASVLNNIGSVYWSLGEMQKALEKLNEALPIRQAAGDRRGVAAALNNIGAVYWSLGESQKALERLNEALTISRAVNDRSIEAQTLTNIGAVYWSLEEMQKALDKFDGALTISRAINHRSLEATTLNNLGMVHNSLGERQKALDNYNAALPISRAIGERSTEAHTLHGIGLVYDSLGEMRKALEKYDEAVSIRRLTGERREEANTLLSISRVEQKLGNLNRGRQIIEEAIRIIESLRSDIRNQKLRVSYFASRQDFYESYIDVLMQMHKRNPTGAFDAAALAASERARARSLLELLKEARADIRQGIDSSLIERERSLQQRLTSKAAAQTSLLNRKHTPAQAAAAAEEIASITTEHEELEAQIRDSSPKYAALTQPQPLNLEGIQQQALDPDTLLLEYSLGNNASYLFVVSQTSITSYQLPKRDKIEAATRRVHDLLTAPQPRPGETEAKRQARIKEARANYWPQAAALSQILLGPAASQLSAKRLLIVADGALQYLPFGALPAPEMERHGDRDTERLGVKGTRRQRKSAIRNPQSAIRNPLIVEREIVHLPSASALAVLRRELAGRQPATKAVAVLADPVFTADDARVKTSDKAKNDKEIPSDLTRSISDLRGELRRLLMTRDEAETIMSVTPRNDGLAALDFRANRATATGNELSDYRIVHFATHGLLNSEHPELSGLVLSLVDEEGRPQDGFLRMHEIFNLRLPAELVVLSACQTGLGKEVKGEGLVGLTRGFMYAGAARVVASLWEVNDVATAELMKRFYRLMLQGGMRPAAALRAAQIEMWKTPQWRSPFYWGAFVLQGEWN